MATKRNNRISKPRARKPVKNTSHSTESTPATQSTTYIDWPSILDTIKDTITKDMLVFSREEAWRIMDITHDYLQMIKHTRNTTEEIRKWYESMLKSDAKLPEGVTPEMIAWDLEKMKEDVKFLDVAELRTTTLRDAAQDFIMSQPDDITNPDVNILPDSEPTSTTADSNVSESVHEVSASDTHILQMPNNETDVSTASDASEATAPVTE